MSYSLDFRRKVLAIKKEKGLSIRETAKRFCIGSATVSRWIKQIEPKPAASRSRKIDKSALEKDVKQYPDAYQRERAIRFGVCQKAIWQALKKLSITYKKTFSHPKADENLRKLFRQKVETYQEQEKPLIFIDESGFPYDLPRNHGYSPKGQLCYGCKDWLAKGRTNAIGALLGTTLLTVTLFDGNINSHVFYSWMTQCLIPVLPQKSVLFMDNVSFHKREDILQAIEKAGHQVEFLPPYSPDLNPIEHKWAQAKRKKKEIGCDIDTLFSVYM
ncbi:IS630 family transposase [Serratia symbiotica]|uniref:Transposase n=2 Tax=Serratia symbiotica TaxID=138074 RepID=A0A455VR56_9GAMM|nr:IS630 family transposase [Serratia symbiotica]BBI93078.1 transposase [Serratia symbiotica]